MGDDPFEGIGRAAMEARISDARLGKTDQQIARMRILDREAWVDIGAACHCDRRTAARRFNRIKDLI